MEVQNSDYYYAYHICPGFSVFGQKARNYRSVTVQSTIVRFGFGPACTVVKGSNGIRNYGPIRIIRPVA